MGPLLGFFVKKVALFHDVSCRFSNLIGYYVAKGEAKV
jgi:hypothetical protein